MTTFQADLSLPFSPLAHVWEHTVGSGHATLALRADWQKQLERCHRELGFQHVRFHGLLCDDMGTLMRENDQDVYSFFNADQICDFLLSIGMRPFMELSFMPSTLASGPETVFHYQGRISPPRDYQAWRLLIHKLVSHWHERYGADELSQWFFEIWNEPNLKAFWTGSQEDYFKLYAQAAWAIKEINPRLRVGGPATAQNAWLPEFLKYTKEKQIPVDFVSTHHYPTDAFGKPGDDTKAQLAQSHRSVLREQAQAAKNSAQGKPLYYTEWSTSSNPFDEMHDQPYAAAYIAKTVMESRDLVQGYSYWTFSDIFEENYFSSAPFHGGFGLMNIYGIPKPAYRSYQLLHQLGNEILPLQGEHSTVDAWLTKKEKQIKVLITNSALPEHPVKTEKLEFSLANTPPPTAAFIERIDQDHANAQKVWTEMGAPDSLSPHQVQALEISSALNPEPFPVACEDHHCTFSLTLPPQGTACITLEFF